MLALTLPVLRSQRSMRCLIRSLRSIGFARNIVECDERIKKIVEFVYGNSIVVKDIEIGTQLLKEGFNDRIVTLEGDIITAKGRMTGGYSVRGKDELLERKKEFKVIKEKMNEIQNEREELSKKLDKLSEILETEENERQKIQKELEVMEENYREFLKEYDNFNSEYNKRKREKRFCTFSFKRSQAIVYCTRSFVPMLKKSQCLANSSANIAAAGTL